MGKSMLSCRFYPKPIDWVLHGFFFPKKIWWHFDPCQWNCFPSQKKTLLTKWLMFAALSSVLVQLVPASSINSNDPLVNMDECMVNLWLMMVNGVIECHIYHLINCYITMENHHSYAYINYKWPSLIAMWKNTRGNWITIRMWGSSPWWQPTFFGLAKSWQVKNCEVHTS